MISKPQAFTGTPGFSIARPSDAEFRRLHNARHEDIAQALDMAPDDFLDFKRRVRQEMNVSLDYSKKFDEQDPSAWQRFIQWSYDAMPSLMSKYEDAWPVELYVRITISKRIAQERFNFRKAMAKYKRTMVLRSSSSAKGESEMSPADPPPPYDHEDLATGSETPGAQMHPDAAPDNIKTFLQSCDFDLGHLTSIFVTRRAGLFNLERLELVASWPAALRRDHLERHFGTMLDDVEIEVLNKRFIEMSHAQI
ncbi:hypothetical protein DEU56DRAFT_795480 [Suillus clintonianus]|uniref:uncharacterized protein n=1 Tax=Suillus clintonianus TaxID=1904413 RepID=UPI001B879B18|nr:uncharacterized protein DEU56DRAFT_795480 [Suillus clintonianus]KAG2141908.1 hypothetical protein DEU56DRAFT_795480 [Suillus clintonianus]